MKNIFLFLGVCSIILSGCDKEEVPFYQGPDGISFYIDQYAIDSLSYSFAFQPIGTEKDTVFLDMRVLGAAKDYPRVIRVVPGPGTTAREGVDFTLPEITLPAGQLITQYPVVVYNTTEMLTQSFRIVAQVADSEDLVPGATGMEVGNTIALNNFKIWVSNKLDKPAYWGDMEYYFGAYSDTKFRFMISTLGITDFSIDNIGYSGLYNFPIKLRNALAEYVAVHGDLIDEFGNIVTFPSV